MTLLCTPVQPAVLSVVSLLQKMVSFPAMELGKCKPSKLAAPSVGLAATEYTLRQSWLTPV